METEQIRVLLVDDDQGDFEMIRVMLSQAEHGNYKLNWVSSYEEALDAFKDNQHDVYLLDYFLEDHEVICRRQRIPLLAGQRAVCIRPSTRRCSAKNAGHH